jgi:bifunctional DNA-binding transcriptional regulator/antitoxin component of YhaV-PrlF toxin-antitoxin module
MERILAEVKLRRNGECIMPKNVRELLNLDIGNKLAIVFDTISKEVKIKRVETDYRNFEIEEKKHEIK